MLRALNKRTQPHIFPRLLLRVWETSGTCCIMNSCNCLKSIVRICEIIAECKTSQSFPGCRQTAALSALLDHVDPPPPHLPTQVQTHLHSSELHGRFKARRWCEDFSKCKDLIMSICLCSADKRQRTSNQDKGGSSASVTVHLPDRFVFNHS